MDAGKSGISEVLNRRRGAVRGAIERRIEEAKESPEQIVACPGDGDDILTEIVNRARNEVRHRRHGDYLHVSDLLSKCQRKVALIERNNLPHRAGRLTLMDMLTFRMGEALHDVIKERAALGAPGAVWGKWKCKCGHLHHDDPCLFNQVDLEDVCEHCGEPTTEYVEVSMFHDGLMLVGNPDLLLYLKEIDAFHVTELKSISHKQWEELVRPKPEHVIQVLFYWYIMKELGYRLTDRVTILYATKGYLFKGSPFKEYSFNPLEELHRLDDYIEEARELKKAREGGELPARTMCAGENSPEARKCEVCNLCFATTDEKAVEVNIEALFGDRSANDGEEVAPIRQRVRRRSVAN
jgi:hypothetical protein